MEQGSPAKFQGVMDHIAVKCEDLKRDVAEYEKIGFTLETLYDDWAMLRDSNGFGIALLPPGSKHPPHIGLRVNSLADLEKAAETEGRPLKPHRDKSISFYTKGIGGAPSIELIYYPPDYGK